MPGSLLDLKCPVSETEKTQKLVESVLRKSAQNEPFLGWVDLPSQKTSLTQSRRWAKQVKKNQKTLIVLGIGGSCLGAKAVYDFVCPEGNVLFLDNIDGHRFEKELAKLNFKATHFMAISKSGETYETLFQLARVLELASKKRLKIKDHFTFVTETKPSRLFDIAQELDIPVLDVPKNVGGRFSVLCNVGLAPLAWSGVNIQQLLAGAQWAKEQKEMIARLSSFYLQSFKNENWISVFWMYVDGLKTFGLWIEQLWAESLGKKKAFDGSGAPRASTPLSCIGATDQHSLLQQFTEGARDKSFMFIRCDQSEKSPTIRSIPSQRLDVAKGQSVGKLLKTECEATEKVLSDLGIQTTQLRVLKYDAKSIGALLFLFEMLVATIGEGMAINAFDQPGVEAVKKITRENLAQL